VTVLFFAFLILLKSPVLLRQSADRSPSPDVPRSGVFGSEYIELFFPGLEIPVRLHVFILLWQSQNTYEHYVMLRMKLSKVNRPRFTSGNCPRICKGQGWRDTWKGRPAGPAQTHCPVPTLCQAQECDLVLIPVQWGRKHMFKILLQGCQPSLQLIRKSGNPDFWHAVSKVKTYFAIVVNTFMEYPWLLFSISNCYGGRNVCGTLSFSEE
jgi:hypothetical protein